MFPCAENRPPDWLIRKRGRVEQFEHEIVRCILDRADFLQDDAFFALELHAVERALGQNVGKNVERERNIAGQDMGVIGGMFGARRGVEIAARRLDLLGDIARRAPPRPLERHMFEKMRQAMLVGAFVARSRADKNTERGGFEMRHALGDDPQAGRQSGDLDAHEAARFAAAARARMKRSISLWSLGKIENLSFRSKRPARWPGSAGRMPVARSIASGNLPG